jgi:stage II sporulation protein P
MQNFYKQALLILAVMVILFTMIGIITTSQPSSRLSSSIFSSWMTNVEQPIFSYLFSMENRAYDVTFDVSKMDTSLSEIVLQLSTSIRLHDVKSLISREIPGFSTYENKIIIASEGMNNMELYSHESGPPLETIFEEREAIDDAAEKREQKDSPELTTGDRQVVFLYNTHNRESFLPNLPNETDPDNAYHKEVNITKISDRMAEGLKQNGIASEIDNTDITKMLNDKGWEYWQSYDASRPVVETALAQNKEIQYMFDLHRDSLPRNVTTENVDGKDYAQILFVIGAENKNYEKNLALATKFHKAINKKYPNLSKGVITKEGPGTDGIFNQDLSANALLMEIGGYENTLDEMYRTTDVIADVFSEMYWDAEKVNN